MKKDNPIVKKQLKDPITGKRVTRLYVPKKGWYTWNTVCHVYNSTTNYDQLRKSDLQSSVTTPSHVNTDLIDTVNRLADKLERS